MGLSLRMGAISSVLLRPWFCRLMVPLTQDSKLGLVSSDQKWAKVKSSAILD